MFLSLYNQKIKVFLADATDDVAGARTALGTVLRRAGIDVVYPEAGSVYGKQESEMIDGCDCSVHVLGSQNIYEADGEGYDTSAGRHYRMAAGIRKEGFRMFLWNPSGIIDQRNMYVNAIRRDIVENVIYSSSTSAIVFVEDLRSIMSLKPTAHTDLTNADMFFIYNDLDRESAGEILSMLQDLHKVASLGINMSSNTDYSEFISSQLRVCRIGIIYSDYAGDWAMPFARQLWKDSGGQSADVPLYMAANSAHSNPEEIAQLGEFMEYTITDKTLIPLDIKIFFDKVTTKK